MVFRQFFAPLCVAAALSTAPALAQSAVDLDRVTDGLEFPWAVAFLPDGGYLVTERDGRVIHVAGNGDKRPVSGGPDVYASGQGGLLDVVLSPDFETDRTVFMTFSDRSSGGVGTSVYRGQLMGESGSYELQNGETIFQANNLGGGGRHFGSRLAFAPDGNLFMTLGDRGDRPSAQDTDNHAGSVLRLTPDGDPAPGNPFLNVEGVQPEIWSIGHRNPQSAAINPASGVLWTVEHGARGGDEINIPEAGKNYGWPVISYGRHYSGFRIGEGTSKSGMEQPIYYWDPSIAPSGMAFVTSDKYPDWQGDLLVGALRGTHLAKLELNGPEVTSEEKLLDDLGERIRDVRQGPDGFIYVLTDSDDGQLIRLTPR
ncbi:PQQ-dependent sugar dehydrogenase [Roseibium denhamense]|uniref:Glucose/arabinose dehydrogenase, beta-propeller fold n=1 Tax=Roseibium denhamense TaxID=76305 RepID=A0ABY1P3Y7_9HYPH|nr:PQQ-dependent sugar dehydrogenase [Roseibium denhamense]MTI07785.1 PQQ-dependent sugar dehydrogenase [Roseibium denhamense]SMP25449.1 Glucose/arabinose dehydrogenase, beta-propeller fold [Roseibium denhamense]